jgi:hypothetical protein
MPPLVGVYGSLMVIKKIQQAAPHIKDLYSLAFILLSNFQFPITHTPVLHYSSTPKIGNSSSAKQIPPHQIEDMTSEFLF